MTATNYNLTQPYSASDFWCKVLPHYTYAKDGMDRVRIWDNGKVIIYRYYELDELWHKVGSYRGNLLQEEA